VPTKLGRYQILRHLATGGMADLLIAIDGDRHVVIKRIRSEQAKDPQFVRMFLDEARLAGSLHHPNIVEVLDIGDDRGEYFFTMEYVHGEDLRNVLRELNRRHDKLPTQQIIAIMCAAAAGLHHAHEKRGADRELLGIVHRDVSPANILVGYDGRVKVADFGIAKAVLRQVETRSGTLKGKVSYMSPEQVTGRPIDRRSDVYALGIVLWEVATARRLFKGDNDFLVMSSIVQGEIPKPSLHRDDLPPPLEHIIMKALATNPSARFQTADDLRYALEHFAESLGMRPTAASIADYMKKLFGSRLEPWLVDDEPTMNASIDFDGSASGVIQSIQPVKPEKFKATNTSPLFMVQQTNADDAAALAAAPSPAAAAAPGPEPVTAMAWSPEPSVVPRRRGLMVGGALAIGALAIGGGVMWSRSSSDDPVATTKAASPETAPAPEVAPAPDVAKPPATPDVVKPAAPDVAKPAAPDVAKPAAPDVAKPAAPDVAKLAPAIAKPVPAIAKPAPIARPPKPAIAIAKPTPAPVAKPVAKPAPKPVAVKPAVKPPAPTKPDHKPKDQAWDPNSLFAPK
jgi:serine/threonine protein kinase